VQGEGVRYSQFINQEYILFSKADCERSIPHIMDGFKPSQRKVLFSCFKRKLKDEIKVAQLAGYIGEHSAYHHGEASLYTTIINMAQSFVGSNNVNLLTPSGQFGTRRMGGKDAASPRYIFTMLEKITRTIFHPDDDDLLNYLSDDGVSIEPDYYMPVIPMVLVNGSDGIGTGWSSKIPNYNPRQIISNIRNMINGEELEEMHPYYSGFKSDITPDTQAGRYICSGIIERTNDTTLVISELPIRTWTQDCKNFLEKMLLSNDKTVNAEIKDFTENHTDTTVKFTITAMKEKIDEWEKLPKGGLYAKFKLITSMSTTNMNLYDTDQKIVKHAKPEGILEAFYEKRMMFYVKRKQLLVKNLRKEQKMLSNKARFVEEVCSGDLVVNNRKKIELLEDLQSRGYDLFDKTNRDDDDVNNDVADDGDNELEDSSSTAELSRGYEYLLGMKLWNLTYEKVEELRKQLAGKTADLEALEAKEPSQIWMNDLEAIELALDERDKEIEQAEEDELKAQKKTASRQAMKSKKRAPAKKRVAKKKKAENIDDVNFVPEGKLLKTKTTLSHPQKFTSRDVMTSSDDDNEMELNLFERLQLSKTISNDSSESSLTGSKRPSPKASSRTVTSTKRAKASKKLPAKKSATKTKCQKKKFVVEKDFVCTSESENDMQVEIVAPAPRSRRTRAARVKAKPMTYVVDDDDSFMVDSDDDSDF
jgi:DNA topoisomerase-2